MNENATETAAAPKIERKSVTLSSGVVVSGANLLPPKMIAIMDYFHNTMRNDTGVVSIIVRDDGRPTEVLGKAYPWAYTFCLNVPYHLERVYDKLKDKDFGLNLKDAVWLALLESWLHETVHVEMAYSDEDWFDAYVNTGSDEDEKENEQIVKELARELLIDLARTVDIEAPAVEAMGDCLAGLFMEKFMTDDSELVKRSKIMLEQGVVYSDETGEDKIYHNTLRSFVRNCLVKSGDDEDWDNVNLVNLSFQMENGEEIVAQAEPVVDTEAVVQETLLLITGDAGAVEEETNAEMAAVEGAFGTEHSMNGTEMMDAEPVAAPVVEVQPVAPAAAPIMPDAVIQPDGEEFVLPQHIVAPADQSMPAAPETTPEAPLPNLGLDMTKVKGCLQEVYMHLYNQMFLKCGWSQNPTTGRYHFPQPYAITASWQISNILQRWGCEGLIHEYTCYAEGEQITQTSRANTRYSCDGTVRGFVFGDKSLPCFELFLNIDGHRIKRRLVPQNPEKQVNNAYTKGADQAAAGNAVMYIFSDASSDQPWHVRCPAKIDNKQYKEQTA